MKPDEACLHMVIRPRQQPQAPTTKNIQQMRFHLVSAFYCNIFGSVDDRLSSSFAHQNHVCVCVLCMMCLRTCKSISDTVCVCSHWHHRNVDEARHKKAVWCVCVIIGWAWPQWLRVPHSHLHAYNSYFIFSWLYFVCSFVSRDMSHQLPCYSLILQWRHIIERTHSS